MYELYILNFCKSLGKDKNILIDRSKRKLRVETNEQTKVVRKGKV